MTRDASPLEGLDLNLLLVLRALLREESVTRAAQRLGQSQPQVSRALATLREAFGDPLLVRAGRSMASTSRASALRRPLEEVLAAIERLPQSGGFEPSTDRRSFRLIMPDLLGASVVGTLAARLAASAPGVDLQVSGAEHAGLKQLLDDAADLVVAAPLLDHPELDTRTVGGGGMDWRVLHGAPVEGPLDLERWLWAEHVQLVPHSRPDVPSQIDDVLSTMGRTRRLRVTVAFVAALPSLLSVHPLVASLPAPVAHDFVDRGLTSWPHPLADHLDPVPVRLTWHRRHRSDPAQRWFRDQVAAVVEAWMGRPTSP